MHWDRRVVVPWFGMIWLWFGSGLARHCCPLPSRSTRPMQVPPRPHAQRGGCSHSLARATPRPASRLCSRVASRSTRRIVGRPAVVDPPLSRLSLGAPVSPCPPHLASSGSDAPLARSSDGPTPSRVYALFVPHAPVIRQLWSHATLRLSPPIQAKLARITGIGKKVQRINAHSR